MKLTNVSCFKSAKMEILKLPIKSSLETDQCVGAVVLMGVSRNCLVVSGVDIDQNHLLSSLTIWSMILVFDPMVVDSGQADRLISADCYRPARWVALSPL